MTWSEAIAAARLYHRKKTQSRNERGVDYDEAGTEYNALPNIVKNALDHLCNCGEIQ